MWSSLALITPMKSRPKKYLRDADQYTSNHKLGESRIRSKSLQLRASSFMVDNNSLSTQQTKVAHSSVESKQAERGGYMRSGKSKKSKNMRLPSGVTITPNL